ncbi:MFS transporter [Herbiconiux solani]|uniref:MFS transporter n=1 Tax=Herbiconiux solani TaxID=661329 RepID=UPI000824C86A|nr:MFS transporter [Herbiconiux solani]
MTEPHRLTKAPLWAGRTLALLAIVFTALNLRTAVAALSPIFDQMSSDIALGSIGIGFLGTLPPICFAVAGLFAPLLHRRFGLEPVVVGALLAVLAGHLVRAASGDYLVLVLGSTLAFAGMGVANVLLPPLVKKYFPDRIGLVTSLYATVMAIGATLPPLIAVPVAEAAGWRTSVGLWSAFAVIALVPMLSLAVGSRSAKQKDARDAPAPGARPDEEPRSASFGKVLRSPIAWSLMLTFALTTMNAYAMFAWLPEIVTDVAGTSQADAGALLSLFSVAGLPASLIVPLLAARMKNVFPLIIAGVAAYLIGYIGLLAVPTAATWLWALMIGFGPLIFPLTLVLINLRTRTHDGSVALSSFTQSFGYALGALGPLVVGILHDATGGWTVPIIFLIVTAVSLLITGAVVSRPRMLEDEWQNRQMRTNSSETP